MLQVFAKDYGHTQKILAYWSKYSHIFWCTKETPA